MQSYCDEYHWLMKEPELDENKLRAETEGNQLAITRQSLQPDTNRVKVLTPSGKSFFAKNEEGLEELQRICGHPRDWCLSDRGWAEYDPCSRWKSESIGIVGHESNR